jgi:DNA repair exonuclease SbcCD ATPase subunit
MSQGKDKISALITKKNNLLKLSNGLKDIPCGLKYPNCTYIAYAIKETEGFDELSYDNEINKLQEDIQNNKQNAQLINEKAQSLENEVKILQPKYEKYLKNKKEYELVNKLKDKIKDLNEELSIFKLDLENYENNVKKQLFYEFKDNLFEFIVDKIKEIKDKKTNILLLKEKIKNCKQSIQFTEFKINEIKKQIDDIEKAKSEICSLEDFCETVGKNGISVKILQDYIPEISALMNAVISNFADFSVELKIDDEKYLEIYLTDNVSTRLIESCSGSQKTIISYALRMALLSYAQIPSSNLFILDEPATSFDENHLLQFNKLLDMIKINNKTILLVTHISLLKDYVDTAFIVDRSSGYSKILS